MEDIKNIQWPGWETVRLIGRGSYGAVYEIERDLFGRKEKAALKHIGIPQNPSDIEEMYSDGYDDESITTAFQSHLESIVAEYSLMRKLNGAANVVNCDDVKYVQREDGIGWDIYIKMELLTPLTKALSDPISEDTVIKIAEDMCQALSLCRRFDIVHRDIKPQNIFVSSLGDYKLGDFGIAKTVEKTMGGTKTGTYKYMAPEVYNNQPYGQQADIYSLGLVLYWLLNKRRMPFMPLPPQKLTAGMDEQARNRRLSGEPFPPPADGREELKNIVLKACAYNPAERYRTADEMLQALKSLNSDPTATPAIAPTEVPPATGESIGMDEAEDELTSGTVGRRRPNVAEEATVGAFGARVASTARQGQTSNAQPSGQQSGNCNQVQTPLQENGLHAVSQGLSPKKKPEEKKKKLGTGAWIAIAACVAVVTGGILLLTLGKGKDSVRKNKLGNSLQDTTAGAPIDRTESENATDTLNQEQTNATPGDQFPAHALGTKETYCNFSNIHVSNNYVYYIDGAQLDTGLYMSSIFRKSLDGGSAELVVMPSDFGSSGHMDSFAVVDNYLICAAEVYPECTIAIFDVDSMSVESVQHGSSIPKFFYNGKLYLEDYEWRQTDDFSSSLYDLGISCHDYYRGSITKIYESENSVGEFFYSEDTDTLCCILSVSNSSGAKQFIAHIDNSNSVTITSAEISDGVRIESFCYCNGRVYYTVYDSQIGWFVLRSCDLNGLDNRLEKQYIRLCATCKGQVFCVDSNDKLCVFDDQTKNCNSCGISVTDVSGEFQAIVNLNNEWANEGVIYVKRDGTVCYLSSDLSTNEEIFVDRSMKASY